MSDTKIQAWRFKLMRHEDVHGMSGTGHVATGTLYHNGYVSLVWLSPYPSMTMFASIDVMMTLHSHEGKTTIEWVDTPTNGAWRTAA